MTERSDDELKDTEYEIILNEEYLEDEAFTSTHKDPSNVK